MKFDYPAIKVETEIIKSETNVDIETARQLAELANSLRELKDFDLEESASTRLLIYAGNLIKSGISILEACQTAIIEPLTDDEDVIEALVEVVKAKFPT